MKEKLMRISKTLTVKTEIIQNKKGEFWTGSSWSDEYPDAKIYTNESKAVKDADKLKAEAIENYGYNNQHVLN